MYEKFEKYNRLDGPVMVLGDINIDTGKSDNSNSKQYNEMLTSLGLSNLIDASTRFGKSKNSILDHILTNFDIGCIEKGILEYSFSDHLPIYSLIKSKPNERSDEAKKQDVRTWQKIDESKKEKFTSSLEKVLAQIDLSKNPEDILNDLTTSTKRAIDECFPPQKTK